jgi:hypothetical protein
MQDDLTENLFYAKENLNFEQVMKYSITCSQISLLRNKNKILFEYTVYLF